MNNASIKAMAATQLDEDYRRRGEEFGASGLPAPDIFINHIALSKLSRKVCGPFINQNALNQNKCQLTSH